MNKLDSQRGKRFLCLFGAKQGDHSLPVYNWNSFNHPHCSGIPKLLVLTSDVKFPPIEYHLLDMIVFEDLSIQHVSEGFAHSLGYRDDADLLRQAPRLPALLSYQGLDDFKRVLASIDTEVEQNFLSFYECKHDDRVLLSAELRRVVWRQLTAFGFQFRLGISASAHPSVLTHTEQVSRFQCLFEQQQHFVTLCSPSGHVLEANNASLIVQGLSREEYLGRVLWQTPAWELLPEWQKVIKSHLMEAAYGAAPVFSDDVYHSQESGIRYARVSYTPIRDKQACLQGVLVQASDMTDQRVLELIRRDNQQRLEMAMTAASMGTWEWSLANDQVYWSEEAFRIFRIEKSLFKGSFDSYLSFVVPESRVFVATQAATIVRKSKEKTVFKYEHEILRGDNTRGWVEVRGRLFLNENGRALRIGGIIMDITEAKRKESELSILYRAMESSSSSVIVINFQHRIEYVNSKFTDITGYTKEDALGQKFEMMNSGETPASVYENLWSLVEAGEEWKGELRNKRKTGEVYWERASISCVKNNAGEITHFVAIQEDVTNEIKMSEKINYQASHDSLTGLINRYEFERNIKALKPQDGSEHALCFLDLDQFKIVNDTCGHAAGDELLRQLSAVLQKVVSDRGVLARLGGDEFAVFLEGCSVDVALLSAKQMLKTVEDFHFAWEENVFRLGVSIGLVPVSSPIAKFSELLKQADTACYMAKDRGRNRIHVYYPDDEDITARHGEMQWATRIYDALEKEKFCLFAQLIKPLHESDLLVYEILVRMRDADEALIPPGAFVSAAERYNLVVKIDRWVVKKVLSLLAACPCFLDDIDFISINLSGQSIADPTTRDYVISQLVQHSIDGSKICFEITETAAILNLAGAEQFIGELRKLGCRFALDDFGSGVSSFGYLKKLPVDYLKIDGMFVKDIIDDPIDYAMVKSINEIGQTMGMMTIAEFVENQAIEEKMREIGVDYVQGYGVGAPLSIETLLDL